MTLASSLTPLPPCPVSTAPFPPRVTRVWLTVRGQVVLMNRDEQLFMSAMAAYSRGEQIIE